MGLSNIVVDSNVYNVKFELDGELKSFSVVADSKEEAEHIAKFAANRVAGEGNEITDVDVELNGAVFLNSSTVIDKVRHILKGKSFTVAADYGVFAERPRIRIPLRERK